MTDNIGKPTLSSPIEMTGLKIGKMGLGPSYIGPYSTASITCPKCLVGIVYPVQGLTDEDLPPYVLVGQPVPGEPLPFHQGGKGPVLSLSADMDVEYLKATALFHCDSCGCAFSAAGIFHPGHSDGYTISPECDITGGGIIPDVPVVSIASALDTMSMMLGFEAHIVQLRMASRYINWLQGELTRVRNKHNEAGSELPIDDYLHSSKYSAAAPVTKKHSKKGGKNYAVQTLSNELHTLIGYLKAHHVTPITPDLHKPLEDFAKEVLTELKGVSIENVIFSNLALTPSLQSPLHYHYSVEIKAPDGSAWKTAIGETFKAELSLTMPAMTAPLQSIAIGGSTYKATAKQAKLFNKVVDEVLTYPLYGPYANDHDLNGFKKKVLKTIQDHGGDWLDVHAHAYTHTTVGNAEPGALVVEWYGMFKPGSFKDTTAIVEGPEKTYTYTLKVDLGEMNSKKANPAPLTYVPNPAYLVGMPVTASHAAMEAAILEFIADKTNYKPISDDADATDSLIYKHIKSEAAAGMTVTALAADLWQDHTGKTVGLVVKVKMTHPTTGKKFMAACTMGGYITDMKGMIKAVGPVVGTM